MFFVNYFFLHSPTIMTKTSEEIVFVISEMSWVPYKVTVPSTVTVNELKQAISNQCALGDIGSFQLRYQNTKLGKDMPVGDIEGQELFLLFNPAGEKY